MPPLELSKFKATAPGAGAPPLDLSNFKIAPPSNIPGANLPMSPFGQKVRETATAFGEEGAERIQKTAEEFGTAVKEGDIVKAGALAGVAPIRAVGTAARVAFSPLIVAIGDAIEGISNMPSVQRIAMGEKVGKFLNVTNDIGAKVGDIAKTSPELAGDVQDFVDTITLAIGPKAIKPVAGAVERVGAKIKEAVPKFAISTAEKEADELLGASVRNVTPDVAETFKKYGIEAPVSAVTPSRAIQGVEAMAQSAWLGGTKITAIVEEAQRGLSTIAESLRKYADPQVLIKPGVTLENVGTELKDALTKAKKSFDEAKTKLYEEATSRIGNQQAILEETRKALDDIIQRKMASSDPSSRNMARYYQQLRNNLSTASKRTFVNVKQTRSDIGSKLGNRTDPIATGDTANLKRIYATLSKDLDDTVRASGVEAANALKIADEFYKAGINKINSMVGRTIRNARSPERIFGSLIKAGDVTMVRELKGLVGTEAFQTVGDAFMNTVIQSVIIPLTGKMNPTKLATLLGKYGDDTIRELVGERGLQQLRDLLRSSVADDIIERATLDGHVQPGRLAQAIEAYNTKVLEKVFSPEELQKLMDLKQMAQAMGRGTKMVAGSPTAEKLQLGINVALGVGPGIGVLLSKLGIEYGVTKLFTTSWGKRLLTRGRLGKGGKTGAGGAKGVEEAQPVVPAVKSSPMAEKVAKQGGQGGAGYRYHETSPSALESIRKNGLMPSVSESGGKGVFFSIEPHIKDVQKGESILLRAKKTELEKLSGYSDEAGGDIPYSEYEGTGEGAVNTKIDPKLLEYSTDGKKWIPVIKQEGVYRYTAYRGIAEGKGDQSIGNKFLSTDKGKAEFYAEFKSKKTGAKGNVVSESVEFKNPLRLPGDDPLFEQASKVVPEIKEMSKKFYNDLSDEATDKLIVSIESKVAEVAKKKGYDGVVWGKGETIIDLRKAKPEGIYRYSEKPTAPVTRESTAKTSQTTDKFGTPKTDAGGLADPTEGGVYYHGVSTVNKKSLLENGFDPSKNKKGFAEQSEAFYVTDYNGSSYYGKDVVGVRVKKGEKIKTLSSSSQEWADTAGKSKSSKETAVALRGFRERGYDAVNYGNEIEILNPKKFDIIDATLDKEQLTVMSEKKIKEYMKKNSGRTVPKGQ